MSPDPQAPEELEAEFRQVAEGLVYELAVMHATLLKLVEGLRSTELTAVQRVILAEARDELVKSQVRFWGMVVVHRRTNKESE